MVMLIVGIIVFIPGLVGTIILQNQITSIQNDLMYKWKGLVSIIDENKVEEMEKTLTEKNIGLIVCIILMVVGIIFILVGIIKILIKVSNKAKVSGSSSDGYYQEDGSSETYIDTNIYRYCPYCGAKLLKDANFCASCGNSIDISK